MSETTPNAAVTDNGEADKISSSHASVVQPVTPSNPTKVDETASPAMPPTKLPVYKRAWAKLGLSPIVFMIMFKPAVAATIAMAIYQRQEVAANYLNFGYLIIIVSITTVPILPRGKFLLNLFLSLFLTCFAAAMVLLGQYAGIKARQHTTDPSAPVGGYNSSASVVNAIFLMINIFGINVLRAARPAFSIPSIQYTVFVMVGFVYGPQEPTEAASQRFLKEVLYSFLTGQAISAAVCLFVIPVSSRKVFFGETTGFLQTCRGLLKAQLSFVEALKHSRLCKPIIESQQSANNGKDKLELAHKAYTEKFAALKSATMSLLGLGAKLREDVLFAKREIAFGHFRETDIHDLHQILRNIMIPISGLSTIADISERMHLPNSNNVSMPKSVTGVSPQSVLDNEQNEWLELVHTTGIGFETVIQVLDESLEHILILLKLIPDKRNKKAAASNEADIEKGEGPAEVNESYSDTLERKIEDFRKKRSKDLHSWAEERGLDSVFRTTAKHAMRPPVSEQDNTNPATTEREILASKRLHIILYMEYLLYSASRAILAAVRFAELKVEDGTMAKQRFVFPAARTVIKIIKGLIDGSDPTPDILSFDQVDGSGQTIELGDSFNTPKDPEHLPPKNLWQSLGNYLRAVPRFLGSAPVSFGVRVTIAVMCIGIVAYLKNTNAFFIKQRVVWCLVMTSVGMNPTSGSAVWNLFGNLTFTIFGMVGSFINWYIVDQKTAGVIVFFFLFMMFYFYFAARYPRFLTCIVAGALTHVLIIGYQLQVRVIGLQIATATGQPFYPIYELGPYRLLTVGAGVLVGYIWTIFPVPISEASVLRRDLGRSLFLLANYLSSVTATLDQRLAESDEDGENANLLSHHGHKLDKMRNKVLGKQQALINSMRQNLAFLAFEPRLGGDFPKKTYEALIDEAQSVTNYLTIIAYASASFPTANRTSTWLSTFTTSRIQNQSDSHKITSLLALLSASITNAQPLPPYLKAPEGFRLSDEILEAGTGVLDLANVDEPGFRAVAVVEVAQRCVVDSTEKIVRLVRELVGEVDFSYRVVGGSRNEDTESVSGGEV